jgi:hypothetical protein
MLFVPERRRSGRVLDVRAADLQEDLTGGRGGRDLRGRCSVRSDEDGGSPANIAASGASHPTQRDPRGAERSNDHSMMTTPLRRGSAPPPRGLSADTPPK